MCEPKPGRRCSADTTTILKSAQEHLAQCAKEYERARSQENPHNIRDAGIKLLHANKKLARARRDHEETTQGIQELENAGRFEDATGARVRRNVRSFVAPLFAHGERSDPKNRRMGAVTARGQIGDTFVEARFTLCCGVNDEIDRISISQNNQTFIVDTEGRVFQVGMDGRQREVVTLLPVLGFQELNGE